MLTQVSWGVTLFSLPNPLLAPGVNLAGNSIFVVVLQGGWGDECVTDYIHFSLSGELCYPVGFQAGRLHSPVCVLAFILYHY